MIHERSFDKLNNFIEKAKNDLELELVVGGKASKQEGFYVHSSTVYRTSNRRHEIISQELFGPIIGVYVYPNKE